MNQENKTTEIEQTLRKTLFYYRLRIGIVAAILIFFLVVGGIVLLPNFRETKYVPPTHKHLDSHSTTYWVDRAQADIDLFRNTETKTEIPRELYLSLMNTLDEARKISPNYARIMAISDIAITMAKNDIDINIDNIILTLSDTPLAASMRTRIIASQSLMFLRLAKRSAARVAIQEYDRIVIEADVKLNSSVNELAFLGVITALACLEDTVKLSDFFNKQIAFSLRITTEQRMRAYRLIAGEQARVGMSVDAMNTAKKIRNPVESVRAYQLIIAYTARPPKIIPTEPSIFLPPIEGPWDPLPEPIVAQQIVNSVIKQIADSKEIDEQVDLLSMLAESRLMCDPEIHRLFRESIINQEFIDELVKRPVLRHLDDPRSELIRASLKLPPLPKNLQQTTDSVLDDWDSPTGAIPVNISEIEPDVIKSMIDRQKINTWLMMSQSYQLGNRYSDAVQVLRKAAVIARGQKQSYERIQSLLKIGEHLLSVGNMTEAHAVFKDIGLPSIPPAVAPLQEEQTQLVRLFTPEYLSYLARLQTVGRFFEDALKTIHSIEPPLSRDVDLVFLAMEQLRIGHFDEVAKTISSITNAAQIEKLQHLSAIAQGGGEEHYVAMKIPFPGNLQDDEELRRCCELLIRNGLFDNAVTAARQIRNPELQSKNLARLVREYVLLFKAYGEEGDWHRSVRETLLKAACSAAEKIVQPSLRAEVLEEILTAVLPYAVKENRKEFLLSLFDEAFQISRRIDVPEEKVELMGKLILSKIALETNQIQPNRSERFPLFNRELNPKITEVVDRLLAEAVDVVNEVGDIPQRGYALSFLAKALGQAGRFQAARAFVKNAEETAGELADKREAVSILLSLIPTLQSLGDIEAVHKIYNFTILVISDSYPIILDKPDTWRVRDSEMDRVVRSQLERDLLAEAVVFANRINEPQLRDRLLRAVVYIYMDRRNFVLAENVLRKIELPDFRTGTSRDLLFMQRHSNDPINSNIDENNNEIKEDEDTSKTEINTAVEN
ncbi:MAG: hypothetical protein LBU34_08055 [Planctomycetaceae bacterium]|jgi:tetratricopeptide (TPR) repeat protein|nr:hypothetical protein [Planctomycetaceae bacterium]